MTINNEPLASIPPLDLDAQDDAAFRARDRAWIAVARVFDDYHETQKLTYAQLGKRISRSRAHVQRWLSSPFNMNLKSLGLLAEGLDSELVIELRPRVRCTQLSNRCHPWEDAVGTLESRLPGISSSYPTEEAAGTTVAGMITSNAVRPLVDA